MGFFKNDLLSSEVAENRNVQPGDKIYIKIDKNTKVITKNSLIVASYAQRYEFHFGQMAFHHPLYKDMVW